MVLIRDVLSLRTLELGKSTLLSLKKKKKAFILSERANPLVLDDMYSQIMPLCFSHSI